MKLSALVLFLAAAPLAAQADLVLHVGRAGAPPGDSVPLTRAIDIDGDGVFAAAEIFALQRKCHSVVPGNCYIMGLAWTIEAGRAVFYGADSGDSVSGECYVFRSVDLDGDGVIGDQETKIFADYGKTTSGSSPDGVAVLKDAGGRSVAYVVNDGGGLLGLWRSVDLNDDGDALDPGETALWAHAGSGLALPGPGGPVALGFGKLIQIRSLAAGGLALRNSGDYKALSADACVWLRLEEDGHGKPAARNFFNPSALNQLDRNVDFQNGKIVDIDLAWLDAGVPRKFNDLDFLAVAPKAFMGKDVYYFATYSKASGGKTGNLNGASQVISGLVFRGVDLNDDGDLNDATEVQLFYNGSGAALPGGTVVGTVQPAAYFENLSQTNTTICDGIDGLAVLGDTVYVAYEPMARQEAILALRDANQDNVIGAGEAKQVLWLPMPFPPLYSAQYGADVRGIVALPALLLPDPQPAGASPYGEGCLGSPGLRPAAWSRGGAPAPGNAAFQLLVSGAPALAQAVLILGLSGSSWPGVGVLPLPLDAFGAPGCSLLAAPPVAANLVSLDAAGAGRVPLPLPPDPGLKGLAGFGQFLVLDAKANPAGLAASQGLKITIQ